MAKRKWRYTGIEHIPRFVTDVKQIKVEMLMNRLDT